MADKVTFKYVYIPADPSQPLEQRELTTTKDDECASLMDEIKKHYRRQQGSSAASRQAHREALMKQAGANAGSVPEEAIQAALNMQMVESIPLMANTPQNGFVAVNMYSDDQASFKGAAPNPRATNILLSCGGNPMTVLGDIFIGRLMDNEEDFARMDFTLDELRSDAPWVREAAAQAARRRDRSADTQSFVERMRGAGANAAQQRPAAAEAAKAPPAEAAKARGNAAVARGDWSAAAEEYTGALKLDPGLVAARNNRALALLKLGRHEESEADCCAVLEAEPSNIKALLRRAAARAALGRREDAATDLRRVAELQPNNKEAAAQLQDLEGAAGMGGGGGNAGDQGAP